MDRPPTAADASRSTGLSRTVTVELLLMRFLSVPDQKSARPVSGHERAMLRKNARARQPCYTPRAVAPHARIAAGRRGAIDNLTLTPAATRSGCEAHTVPPL